MTQVSIPASNVAKYYLISELSKIFKSENIQNEIRETIDRLSEKELWRFLEALSFSYRLNGIFWKISDSSFVWYKENVHCKDLVLTGMNPNIDKITYSKLIRNNPIKFRDYLISYFRDNPDEDPKSLNQFRPSGLVITHPTIILEEKEKQLYLLDGSNRLIAQLLAGKKMVNAYVGRKIKVGKPRIGDSTFWLLRKVYEESDEINKSAVLKVVKQLIKTSHDGEEAVRTYWIDHVSDKKLKSVGEQILRELNEKVMYS